MLHKDQSGGLYNVIAHVRGQEFMAISKQTLFSGYTTDSACLLPIIPWHCATTILFQYLKYILGYKYLELALVLLFKSEFIGAICIHRVPVRLVKRIKALNQWS